MTLKMVKVSDQGLLDLVTLSRVKCMVLKARLQIFAILNIQANLYHTTYVINEFLAVPLHVRQFFLTASKYCGSGLKIDLVVVVILVLVIKLLSNSSPFVKV